MSLTEKLQMNVTDWASEEVPQSLLNDYLEVVTSGLGLAPPPAEGSVSESAVPAGLLSHAVCRGQGLAAFRLHRVDGSVVDTACVRVSEASVRLVVSQRIGPTGLNEMVELLGGLAVQLRPAKRPTPSFIEFGALLASRGRVQTSTATQALELADLRAELSYYKEALREQDDLLRQARAQAKATPLVVEAVRFAAKSDEEPSPQCADLADLPVWCAQNEDRIAVLPRALNGCKKSLYEAPADIFAGLEFLAGPYRLGRVGQLSKSEVQAALEATGLRMAGSAGPSVAGAQGDAYFVPWRGRRRFLEFHLLKGGGREERFCLRIYYLWCDETQRVVVGSMPAHLDNSLS